MLAVLTAFSDTLLSFLNISADYYVFGNTLGAYTTAGFVFVFALAIFGLGQFFALSWIASIASRTETDLDDSFVKMVKSFRPPFYLFLAVWLALHTLNVSGIAANILTFILIVWLVYQAVIIVGILIEDVVFRHLVHDKDETTQNALHILANLAKGIIWVLGVLLALSNIGVNVTSLVAGAGIAGLAIAFALQGILSDLFSSFSIYFDKPFKVGDFIIVGESMGVVKHIGIKSTRIQALSGEEITLSNQELTSARIRNFKRMDERRVQFGFGILYETPVDKVQSVSAMVRTAIQQVEGARFDRAHFKSFGESSLDFEVVYYVTSEDYTTYMDIQERINLALLKEFSSAGIGFAYPTRTIYTASVSS